MPASPDLSSSAPPTTSAAGPAIVWFRRDLRLDDNPAWAAATARHVPILALFVLDQPRMNAAGPHRRRQYLADLGQLDARLRNLGGLLRVVTGAPETVVLAEARRLGAATVHVNVDHTPAARRRDDTVAAALAAAGVGWDAHWGGLVHPPGRIRTGAGTLSQVFTPFWTRWRAEPIDRDLDAPPADRPTVLDEPGEPCPRPDGPPSFPPGEAGARSRLAALATGEGGQPAAIDAYVDAHDLPAVDGTTQLSAALRAGTVSPRHVLDALGTHSPGREAVARQLAWRDWFAHLTWEHPDIAEAALRPAYDRIAWRDDPVGFAAWRDGRTGYPIVDAGMRQLASIGWMHNRVRMITASFLVKDLLIDWRLGERWFRTMLVDGEVSQNAGNWQWVAGTGPDAAPYFRIFNPTTQGKKFDPHGDYVRRWVPELADVDTRHVHEPWRAGGLFGAADYPPPILDHAEARRRCLDAYAVARGEPAEPITRAAPRRRPS